MKRAIVLIISIAVVLGGGAIWLTHHGAAPPPAADAPAADETSTHVSHDEQGNAVISMDDDAQGDAGIVVGKPVAAQWSPEIKAYGRVLDPAPLTALVNEMASAQINADASQKEFERQKVLSGQSNTSARAVQTAEAEVQRDQLAVKLVRDNLTLQWGETIASRTNLPLLAQSLIARQSALLRVDLPGGETLPGTPSGARIVTLSNKTTEAKFLSAAAAMDPQAQGQGFIFSIESNTIPVVTGEGVTAYLQVPGKPLAGVVIPRSSVVRIEGAGWVYVMNQGGESFTRRKIPLDRPTDDGWFVTGNIKAEDYVATTGAQTLLSEELKAALSPD